MGYQCFLGVNPGLNYYSACEFVPYGKEAMALCECNHIQFIKIYMIILTVFKLTFKEGAVAKEVSVKKKLEDEVKVCS